MRWLLIGFGCLIGILVIGSVAVAALGISISAGPFRHQLSDAMTRAIGREVRFEGAMEMQPSLMPSFSVGGITLANPAGFSAPFFASLGHATLRVDLMALLRGEVRVRELSAKDVKVHLERNGQAQVNWLIQLTRTAEVAAAQPKAGDAKPPLRLVAVDHIVFNQLLVDYVGGPRLAPHTFTLNRLDGSAGDGQPLTLKMQGSVEQSFPYTVTVKGGALSALTDSNHPWPIEFGLEFAGTVLNIAGSVRPDAASTSANLTFGMGADDLSNLQRLLQVNLPPVGAIGLSGQVVWENGVLNVTDLRGAMGQSVLQGQLLVDLRQAAPRIKGEFNLPVFDVTPIRGTPGNSGEAGGDSIDLQALKEKHNAQQFEFRELAWVEADVALKVERWIGLPGDVRESTLQVSIHGGVLKAPVQTILAEVPLVGVIDLDGAAPVPAFQIEVGADQTQLGQLARLLTGAEGMKGRLGHFLLRFAATGKNIDALLHSLEMKLEVADADLTYGNIEGGKPVAIRLDRLMVELPPGGRLSGAFRGALLGERFAADFKGGDLASLSDDVQWPVEILATGSGTTLGVKGKIAAPQAHATTDLSIDLRTPRAGDVARWLGLSPTSRAPVALSGRVQVERNAWRLSDLKVQLGKTKFAGNFARVGIERKPLIQAQLRVENLELAELESMLPPPKPGPSKPVIDLPILPQGVDLSDADMDVAIQRIALTPAPVTDITFIGNIRNGKMLASPFSAKYADTVFRGAMELDMRGKTPQATVWVAAEKPDIGRLLRTLKVVETLDVKADLLQLQLIAKGHRLGEMLERSALVGSIDAGSLLLGDVNGKGGVRIALSKGVIEAQPKQPVHVDLDGLIDQTEVKIRLASGSVSELLHASAHVPFSLTADAAETHLGLSGKVSLPISQREVELQLSVAGAKLNSLEQLARTSLPHWGPYELESRFRVTNAGYEMPGLALKVGASELTGAGRVTLTGVRPKIELQLTAPRIQLDDFKLIAVAPAEKPLAIEGKKLSEEELRKKAKEASAQTEQMLSAATLKRQDVTLAVEVGEVLSGRDRLGSGSLRAVLHDGKLALGPAEVNVPGGSAKLWASYYPSEKGIALDAKIRVDRFDYGVLARRLKPEANVQGLFSLDLNIKSQTPSLERAMQFGSGQLDFAVWPQNMKSGIFDLWAVNLFVALIPAVDPAKESKVNCAVGRFNLNKGILTEDAILLDTSRMRVTGTARVDFDTEVLALNLAPKPKKPQFFSLATPVQVSGKVTKPKIEVSTGAVLGTAGKLFTSIITTPFARLFSKEIPRDGHDVCADALRQPRAPRATGKLAAGANYNDGFCAILAGCPRGYF